MHNPNQNHTITVTFMTKILNNRYGQDYQYDYKKSDSYGKDTDYDKYKKDSNNIVSVKKLKCNNINVNLNNINATFGSPVETDSADGSTNNGAVSAQGGENLSDSAFMNADNNGDKSFVDKENNFAFICINNN